MRACVRACVRAFVTADIEAGASTRGRMNENE